ncbi:MAG: hypothetical protein WC291_11195 [Thermodesulfovibrionales bacterium]
MGLFSSIIKKGRKIATRVTALVALILMLLPSMGYAAISLTQEACGCSSDTEFACYCCIDKDGHHAHEKADPCYRHACKAAQGKAPAAVWQGETVLLPGGSNAEYFLRSETVLTVSAFSLPIHLVLIEKPPA